MADFFDAEMTADGIHDVVGGWSRRFVDEDGAVEGGEFLDHRWLMRFEGEGKRQFPLTPPSPLGRGNLCVRADPWTWTRISVGRVQGRLDRRNNFALD